MALFPRRRLGRAGGFTLVEVLVVIGVVALLIALLAPAMSAVKRSGRQAAELSGGRQLIAAYSAYAVANNDFVLPGYADLIPNEPGNPAAKRLTAYDAGHQPIQGGQLDTARKRYVWRLAPYLKYNLRGLYLNDHEEELQLLEQQNYNDYLYKASLIPSLGLNTEWLGGDIDAYGFLPPTHPLRNVLDFDRYYVTRSSHVLNAGKLMVFCSARGEDPNANTPAPVQGWFKVTSPRFVQQTGYRWSERFNENDDPGLFGFVSPRYGDAAVCAFFDGHCGTLTSKQLTDMRHWANWATSEDWTLPQLN